MTTFIGTRIQDTFPARGNQDQQAAVVRARFKKWTREEKGREVEAGEEESVAADAPTCTAHTHRREARTLTHLFSVTS
jgi:hypothetical protein